MDKARRRERQMARTSKEACTFKLRYPNILSALQCCASLEAKGDSRRNPVIMYFCDLCGYTHVGHLGAGESYLMYGGCSENIRELQGGATCPN
jgi:hypothetical protein